MDSNTRARHQPVSGFQPISVLKYGPGCGDTSVLKIFQHSLGFNLRRLVKKTVQEPQVRRNPSAPGVRPVDDPADAKMVRPGF